MWILGIFAFAFCVLFMVDKMQTAAILVKPGYEEKNPVQRFIWKLVGQRPNIYLPVNFVLLMIMVGIGGAVYGLYGTSWATMYFAFSTGVMAAAVWNNYKVGKTWGI